MPVISDIGSLANFVLNLVKVMLEKPIIFVAFIIAILFFPLNVIDLILSVLVNIFILLANVLMFIIMMPIFILLDWITSIINLLIDFITTPINWILDPLGQHWSPLTLYSPAPVPPTIAYMDIDIFANNDTIIGLMVNGLGLSFPLF